MGRGRTSEGRGDETTRLSMVAKKLENYKRRRHFTPEQVSERGVFETCRPVPRGLEIEIGYNGRAVLGHVVGHSLNAPNLNKLRHFLLEYSSESMTTIGNLDVEPYRFNTR